MFYERNFNDVVGDALIQHILKKIPSCSLRVRLIERKLGDGMGLSLMSGMSLSHLMFDLRDELIHSHI
jgi:hypothetical protein